MHAMPIHATSAIASQVTQLRSGGRAITMRCRALHTSVAVIDCRTIQSITSVLRATLMPGSYRATSVASAAKITTPSVGQRDAHDMAMNETAQTTIAHHGMATPLKSR